ncbi:MAG: leucyl aminopeptidase family protein [Pseudobdellovibrionaceae bacterium]
MELKLFSQNHIFSTSTSKKKESLKAPTGYVFVFGDYRLKEIAKLIQELAPSWQREVLAQSKKDVLHFVSEKGPVWIISKREWPRLVSHGGQLEDSVYSWHRDQFGSLVSFFKAYHLKSFRVEVHHSSPEIEKALIVGLDLAAYAYKSAHEADPYIDFPVIHLHKATGDWDLSQIKKYQADALAINWARHLVNMPPNFLNPTSFREIAEKVFSKRKNLNVEVWNATRLEKEGMGLHLGVGQGSENPPCLIHLRYRPKSKSSHAPVAFVGKGITFDTGGLDIKPSSGMRLMKKDMGGAASIFAMALWADMTSYPHPLDFYLGLAENSVDSKSFRPSDVLIARNGMSVEIHNTDAEGRLVLADVLDVAVTQKGKNEPSTVINVATLTGAIKVALGADVAGLFSNHDELAEELSTAGQRAGDLNWRMPLVSKYTQGMNTPFADIVNAVDGFGGSITAALFLEKFVRQKPWAHLDVYCWTDKAQGAYGFAGGNGQPVQCLIEFLRARI